MSELTWKQMHEAAVEFQADLQDKLSASKARETKLLEELRATEAYGLSMHAENERLSAECKAIAEKLEEVSKFGLGLKLAVDALHLKLAEQQAVLRIVNTAFDRTAAEVRSGYLSGGSVEVSDLRVEAWRAVANCDDTELRKLLESNVPEDVLKKYCVSFFYWWHNSPGTNTQDGYDEWFEKFGKAMLSAVPQPNEPKQ